MRPEQNPFIRWSERLERYDSTDEVWIEKVREELSSGVSWRLWFAGVVLLLMSVCGFYWLFPVLGIVNVIGTGLADPQMAWAFAAGALLATMFIVPFLTAFMAGLVAFWDLRSRRLLLKYYNAFRELEREMTRESTPHT